MTQRAVVICYICQKPIPAFGTTRATSHEMRKIDGDLRPVHGVCRLEDKVK